MPSCFNHDSIKWNRGGRNEKSTSVVESLFWSGFRFGRRICDNGKGTDHAVTGAAAATSAGTFAHECAECTATNGDIAITRILVSSTNAGCGGDGTDTRSRSQGCRHDGFNCGGAVRRDFRTCGSKAELGS